MTFKDLQIGEVFTFDRSETPFGESLQSGPFQKTSNRNYCWRNGRGEIVYSEVGTVKVKVIRSEENI